MPQNVINLLESLMQNGVDPEVKILSEGIKTALEILADVDAEVTTMSKKLDKHMDDKDCHTPKGLLVRNGVIFWWATLTILISAIVAHAPELLDKIPIP